MLLAAEQDVKQYYCCHHTSQHTSQHSMPKAVEDEFLKRNPTKKLVVGVAIDGSALSDRALQTACGLIQQERGDRLVILHVADSR